MIKFKEWYEAEGYNPETLAEKLHVSAQAIYKWQKGERRPGRVSQKDIFLLSKGEIQPNDWVL